MYSVSEILISRLFSDMTPFSIRIFFIFYASYEVQFLE